MSAVLHTGDCLDILRTLPDSSVDAVVTDPPYGLNFPYHGYDDSRENLERIIRIGFPEIRRVSRRAFILPGVTQVGLYPNPDWILCVTWNTTGSHGKFGFSQWMPVLCYGSDVKGFARLGNGMLKSDVISISGGAGVGFRRSEEEKRHTCPKPINVMQLLIKRLTNESDSVLDPFMGSGTTGVACVMEGRQFIGIEQDPAYVEIARQRIEAVGRMEPKQADMFKESSE